MSHREKGSRDGQGTGDLSLGETLAPDDPEVTGEVDDPSLGETLASDDPEASFSFNETFASGPPPSPVDPSLPEDAPRLPGYRVLGLLGRGGMGSVWRALQLDTRREVAAKVLPTARQLGPRARARFAVEVEATAQLEHPHIARLYDAVIRDDLCFYAMELIDGQELHDFVASRPLKLEEKVLLAIAICRAVQYAHQRGVIHRDLKPSNIMVTRDGAPRVLDFGLAKLSAAGVVDPREHQLSVQGALIGTPAYMSPEQARGDINDVDTRTDVHALGVIFCELFTGQHPLLIDKPQVVQIIARLRARGVVPPRGMLDVLDQDLEAILRKSFAPEPSRRYATVGELADDLQRSLDLQPVLARPQTLPYLLAKGLRRRRVEVAIVSVVLISLMTVALFTFIAVQRERDAAEAAREVAERRFNQVRALARVFIHDFNDALSRGPTSARKLLVATAQRYLGDLSKQTRDDEAVVRLELAEAYLAVALVQDQLRKTGIEDHDSGTEEAVANLARVTTLLDALAKRPDADAQRIAVLRARVGTLLSAVDLDIGETARAIARLERARAALEPMTARRPHDVGLAGVYHGACQTQAIAVVTSDQPKRGIAVAEQCLEASLRVVLRSDAPAEDDTVRRYLIARALFTVGDVSRLAREYGRARETLTSSVALLRDLSAEVPDDLDISSSLASSLLRLGMTLRQLGVLDEAAVALTEALELRTHLAWIDRRNRELQRRVASGHQRLAMLQQARGALSEAAHHDRQAIILYDLLLTDDPAFHVARRSLAEVTYALGRVQWWLGAPRTASVTLRDAIARFDALIEAEPTTSYFSILRIISIVFLAEALTTAGDLDEALEACALGFEYLAPLVEARPGSATLGRLGVDLSMRRARALRDRGALEEARVAASDALARAETLVTDRPSPLHQRLRGLSRMTLASTWPADSAEAREAIDAAIEDLESLDPGEREKMSTRRELAEALVLRARLTSGIHRGADLERATGLLEGLLEDDEKNALARLSLFEVLQVQALVTASVDVEASCASLERATRHAHILETSPELEAALVSAREGLDSLGQRCKR